MKAKVWLELATKSLSAAGIGSANLDALILLEDELQTDRSLVLAHPELSLTKTSQKRLNARLQRRLGHEPLAYIRGWSEFYGRRFKVNKHVLEPRPESETMIEILKALDLPKSPHLADVGTGSGCLGITAALEIALSHVELFDIDASALAVAKHNAVAHELKLKAYKTDLIKGHSGKFDVILANLPYVPDNYRVNQAAAMEPKIAIYGGSDGLEIYRRLFGQLSQRAFRPAFVLTEALPPQHKTLASIAGGSGYKLSKSQDFIQLFKI